MTTWNYRVIVHDDGPGLMFAVHEVYYAGDKINFWTENAVGAVGFTEKELRDSLAQMKLALAKPFLKEKQVRGKDRLVEYKP